MYVSEDRLVKESCGLESIKFALETTDNLTTTLWPYIQGHVNLREASPSPQKPAPKKVSGQSRQARKNVTKMSESEDSRTTDEEDSPGAELASRIPSSDQNKIRREMMQNLPITHIHRPLVDAKTGRRPLEIREPHKLHVQNQKKKMKINLHATVVPFIVMVHPKECANIDTLDVRKHAQYNYYVIGGLHTTEARRATC